MTVGWRPILWPDLWWAATFDFDVLYHYNKHNKHHRFDNIKPTTIFMMLYDFTLCLMFYVHHNFDVLLEFWFWQWFPIISKFRLTLGFFEWKMPRRSPLQSPRFELQVATVKFGCDQDLIKFTVGQLTLVHHKPLSDDVVFQQRTPSSLGWLSILGRHELQLSSRKKPKEQVVSAVYDCWLPKNSRADPAELRASSGHHTCRGSSSTGRWLFRWNPQIAWLRKGWDG